MKKIIYSIAIFVALLFVSCSDDFLERTPLDDISEPEFWKTTSDLELYANSFYQNLPGWAGVGNGFASLPDNGTDLGLYTSPSDRLLGNTNIPAASNTATTWNWSNVRKANYFIDNVSKATGAEADINQFTGEGYFFRAYYYYGQLRRYGDLPIIDKYIDNTDEDYLFKARDPRNEVADFILADLDLAISLLKSKSDLTSPRISKEAAQLLKATVALYEGSWEKYHSGTDFGVSGSTGADYFQQAADAAKNLIDGGVFTLHNDYESLFNQTDLSGNGEIIMWREYDWLTFGSSYGNDSQISWPNRSSYTRFAIRSYLCTDGQPISVSPLYQGDTELANLETNRDPRLAATVMVPGDVVAIAINGDTTAFTGPRLTTNNSAVSGYESQKFRIVEIDAATGNFTRNAAKIIMRYAEALLIYAEAKAELGTITQADLDISINQLRARANMPNLVLGSITTDLDWPDYGYQLSDVLYEIRRERSVELMNEGLRFDDLMRWRAHNLFVGKTPKGAYYEPLLMSISSNQPADADNYLDPYQTSASGGYGFDPNKDYLSALPAEELILNPNLVQNPGW